MSTHDKHVKKRLNISSHQRYEWLPDFLSTMRQQFTPIRMAKIKTSDNTKCWQVHKETELLIHCWWKDKNGTDILEDS